MASGSVGMAAPAAGGPEHNEALTNKDIGFFGDGEAPVAGRDPIPRDTDLVGYGLSTDNEGIGPDFMIRAHFVVGLRNDLESAAREVLILTGMEQGLGRCAEGSDRWDHLDVLANRLLGHARCLERRSRDARKHERENFWQRQFAIQKEAHLSDRLKLVDRIERLETRQKTLEISNTRLINNNQKLRARLKPAVKPKTRKKA